MVGLDLVVGGIIKSSVWTRLDDLETGGPSFVILQRENDKTRSPLFGLDLTELLPIKSSPTTRLEDAPSHQVESNHWCRWSLWLSARLLPTARPPPSPRGGREAPQPEGRGEAMIVYYLGAGLGNRNSNEYYLGASLGRRDSNDEP